ncbi:hypothetical protein BFP75_10340 [Maribacter sp. 4G9]|nr:hypothetical protein BFP75_10340 [Maribacter sp. 4G9]
MPYLKKCLKYLRYCVFQRPIDGTYPFNWLKNGLKISYPDELFRFCHFDLFLAFCKYEPIKYFNLKTFAFFYRMFK